MPEHNKQLPSNLEPRPNLEIKTGDLLLTCAGPRVRCGVPCLVKETRPKLMMSGKMYRMRVSDSDADARYIEAALRSNDAQAQIDSMKTGMSESGMNLTHARFAELTVPLAPVKEQQRIADKLDVLLSRVDSCRERLDRVPAILKRFRQSVLAAATSGKLTEDWREENSRSNDWNETTLGQVGIVSGGLTKNALRKLLPLQRPYLRVANVYANELRLEDVSEIGLTNDEFVRTKLKLNDLLIVEGNGSIDQIGRAAIWDDSVTNCCHQNHIIRWRATGELLPTLALYWLMSPKGRDSLVSVAKSTTGLHTLSLSKVSMVPVSVPHVDEQVEIVRRVQELFALADALDNRSRAGRNKVESLTPSLLAKAFRGELVPQDPSDEPASELLKRIQATRAAQSTPKKKVVKQKATL